MRTRFLFSCAKIVESMPEPRPHFNTVATFLKGLETKGVGKKSFSEHNRYHPIKELEPCRRKSWKALSVIFSVARSSRFHLDT